MVTKPETETIEYFVPTRGLDVQAYIDQVLPENATPKQIRLRKQAIHHIGRYVWAGLVLKHAPPGRILDVACGSGYGSKILAEALPNHEIIGGDYDERAVKHATENFGGLPNQTYRNVDIVTWTDLKTGGSLGKFDYIVSFDTVEHLLHREIAFVNLAENLMSAGQLLLSTPSGRKENLLNPGWEHHKIEYSYKYLYNLMKRFFYSVSIPDDSTLPQLSFWNDVINKGETRYFLRGNPMVCSGPIAHGLDYFDRLPVPARTLNPAKNVAPPKPAGS